MIMMISVYIYIYIYIYIRTCPTRWSMASGIRRSSRTPRRLSGSYIRASRLFTAYKAMMNQSNAAQIHTHQLISRQPIRMNKDVCAPTYLICLHTYTPTDLHTHLHTDAHPCPQAHLFTDARAQTAQTCRRRRRRRRAHIQTGTRCHAFSHSWSRYLTCCACPYNYIYIYIHTCIIYVIYIYIHRCNNH